MNGIHSSKGVPSAPTHPRRARSIRRERFVRFLPSSFSRFPFFFRRRCAWFRRVVLHHRPRLTRLKSGPVLLENGAASLRAPYTRAGGQELIRNARTTVNYSSDPRRINPRRPPRRSIVRHELRSFHPHRRVSSTVAISYRASPLVSGA